MPTFVLLPTSEEWKRCSDLITETLNSASIKKVTRVQNLWLKDFVKETVDKQMNGFFFMDQVQSIPTILHAVKMALICGIASKALGDEPFILQKKLSIPTTTHTVHQVRRS